MSEHNSNHEGDPVVLYLTTRDINTPRTGADNRSKYLYDGLDDVFAVDAVSFERTDPELGPTTGVTVSYPPREPLAILSPRFMLAVLRAVREEEYDVVVTSGIGAVVYGVVASLVSGATFVFDDHNVEYAIASDASLPRFVVVYALERLACAIAALVVVPTTEVQATLAPWTRGDVEVVTNGFDAETFTPNGESATFEGRRLLFFGNFRYEPNVEAVEYLIEELSPRLDAAETDARILLAGPGHEILNETYQLPPVVELLGFVDDLPAAIRGVDLVVVPLRSGSGSRLKIIESLACGTKVVSTPIGAEGWPRNWKNLILADLEEFADAVIESLDDPTFDRTEHDQIAQYSWQTQARRFASHVRKLVDAASEPDSDDTLRRD